ncbi:Serine/threonine-protein kinase PknB [Aquisphaera giovannonii]|uniref:Serine/threonine-protein kinase PknB n=2 Tax=Aquisphaera giovannonii TaxID=406548 RepID=A0A5B9VZ28_9BACT|nr:Serine/threonine-protein kinase PknB [Aquisphaera giovannonii]
MDLKDRTNARKPGGGPEGGGPRPVGPRRYESDAGPLPWDAWNLPAESAESLSNSAESTVLRSPFSPRCLRRSDLPHSPQHPQIKGSDAASSASAGEPPAGSNGVRLGRGRLPSVGDEIGGFRLVLELGRGAFARVFLAEEARLAGRLVAVKISRAEGDEPRMLARLHHANIMPVHSVHDDPATGLRVLCMPYFGGANLAQVLNHSWGFAQPRPSGKGLVEAIDELSHRIPEELRADASFSRRCRSRTSPSSRAGGALQPSMRAHACANPAEPVRASERFPSGFRSLVGRLVGGGQSSPLPAEAEKEAFVPSRMFLRNADGLHAAVWIAARLAEGLDHAHSHGLLHRDLKPANILIAADGTPMLLDFNLAAVRDEDGRDGDGASRAALGGTIPYMSPEHLDALDAAGTTTPDQVDERSDLYSLGLILFEMIAGVHPFLEILPGAGRETVVVIRQMIQERSRTPVPSLRAACPNVPWSLDALVAKCLDPDPGRRYQSAHDLGEDLRRFLDNLPMKHCPEPSVRERAAKWARRHPTLASSTSIACLCVALVVVLGGIGWKAYDTMLGLSARMKLRAFESASIEAQFLLSVGSEASMMIRGMEKSRALLESLGIPGPDLEAPMGGHQAPPRGSTDERGRVVRLPDWVERLTPEEAGRVRQRAASLLILHARAGVTWTALRGSAEDRRLALSRGVELLEMARTLDPELAFPVDRDRARFEAALEGRHDEGTREGEQPGRRPTSPEAWALLASSLLADGEVAAAEAAIREALAQDVTSLWAWFALGHCYHEQRRYLEAAGCFSACVALGPGYPICHFNRGLSLARGGRLLEAVAAYDHAVRLDPSLVEARANRALVELELDRVEDALADLRVAERAGCREPAVLAALGESLARLGRPDEAEAWFSDLLRSNPADAVVRIARGMSRLSADPQGAMADFTAVLARDPRSPLAHYGAARVLRRHDHRGAISHLNAAIEADPDLIDAIELRALERGHVGERSALEDVDRLTHAATPRRLYNAACALALYGNASGDAVSLDRAIEILSEAIRAGFPPAQAARDPDLAAIRDRPEFARMTGRPAAGKPRSGPPRA